MKKYVLNHVTISVIVCLLFSSIAMSQKNRIFLGVRLPVQLEFQKENVPYPVIFEYKEQKSTVLNYGIDILVEKEYDKKISVYTGTGYFRNKFNFKKFYDHELLNRGTDSIPIGTSTNNYIYNLVRFPVGFSYKIRTTRRTTYRVGGEFLLNYSFQKVYNGKKPFPDANNKLSDFQYSGNSINLFACIAIPINHYSIFELEHYVRVYHTYKQDLILYESPSKTSTRSFNAVGLSFKYYYNLKKQ